MTCTDDILNQIDSALTDATVSPDAMRSTPVPDSGLEVRAWIAPPGTDIDGDRWQELGSFTSIDIQLEPPVVDPEFAQAWRDMQEYIARIQTERIQLVAAALEAMRRAFQQLAPAVQQAGDTFQHLPEAVGCDACGKPVRPRDRPAWQSPYGPARRRR